MANSKKSKSTKKQRLSLGSSLILGLVLLTGLGIPLFLNLRQNYRHNQIANTVLTKLPEPGIDPSLVCMVNDAFMGEAQIPVPHGDKIYFGCCEMCVNRIQNDETARMAQDPWSSQAVDKAEAFIVIDPKGERNQVLYFANEENYNRYQGEN